MNNQGSTPKRDAASEDAETYTAFLGEECVGFGSLEQVLAILKGHQEQNEAAVDTTRALLIFHDRTGRQVDFDLRGSLEDVIARANPKPAPPAPGRPRLGVVAREISLLPRHWEWLEGQPNGASAALRRLVDEARKADPGPAEEGRRIEAVANVMTVMGGNLPGFEEACRALYARNFQKLEVLISPWPGDIRSYIAKRLGLTAEGKSIKP